MIVRFSRDAWYGRALLRWPVLRRWCRQLLGTDVLPWHWEQVRVRHGDLVVVSETPGDPRAAFRQRDWKKYVMVVPAGTETYQLAFLYGGNIAFSKGFRCAAVISGPVALRLGGGQLRLCGWWTQTARSMRQGEITTTVVDAKDLPADVVVI